VSADPGVTLFAQDGPLFRADGWPQPAGRRVWAVCRRDRGPL